ncbi:hypothetical protein PAECIP111893_00663 [Paenibacillus plantiphilus]|uniref:Uncharacterized protein n=1 Tax=Paenibacillus plantiphilus TaxID=2905650 RepID=A0ABN8G546_9BACL|nr:hypothetical protein [Paenibacillus plantiphilus]CAH1195299.1 hypothetical protein PAECIP111893_00663 [Paenibacillus plantiphilus]
MSDYSLIIKFDSVIKMDSDPTITNDKLRLVIAKSASNSNSLASVVWMTVNPAERNTISWVEDYSVYSPTSHSSAEESAVESFNEGQPSASDAPINYLPPDVVVNGEVISGATLLQASPFQHNQVNSVTDNAGEVSVSIQLGTETESGLIKIGEPIEIALEQNTTELTVKYDPATGRLVFV